MEVSFYRCYECKRLDEIQMLLARHKCICGSRKFNPSQATRLEILWFVIKNPRYLVMALKGAK